jgi:hypothetical protein
MWAVLVFLTIHQLIIIRIRFERIGADAYLRAIVQPILVSIGI